MQPAVIGISMRELLETTGRPSSRTIVLLRDSESALSRSKIVLAPVRRLEPSIYPGFVELAELLTARHYISLNTNLTHASFRDFAQRVKPSRVSFINAGFHLQERDRRSGHKVFLKHAELLLACNFPLFVSLVADPTALERFDDAVAILQPLGIVPIPKLFRGMHEGKAIRRHTAPRTRSASPTTPNAPGNVMRR